MIKTIMATAVGLGLLANSPAQAEHKSDTVHDWLLNHTINGHYGKLRKQVESAKNMDEQTMNRICDLTKRSVDYVLFFEGMTLESGSTVRVYYRSEGKIIDDCVKKNLDQHEKYKGSSLTETEHEGLYRIIKQTH